MSPLPGISPDDDELTRWLRHYFLELTHSEKDTEWLIAQGIDPHDLEPLLDRGCPLNLAKQILHPV